MHGNEPRGLILQDRDRHLFRELGTLRVIDREQAKMIAGFGSTTRANSRLLALTRRGLLRRFFTGTDTGGKKSLYTLTRRAAEIADVPHRDLRRRPDELFVADYFVNHQLSVNNVYCAVKYREIPVPEARLLRWVTFHEPLSTGNGLVPDGYAEVASSSRTVCSFLEVDLGNEGRTVWNEKVRRYLAYAISGDFERRFGQPQFRVLVIANSVRRVERLRSLVVKQTEKLFWFTTLESIASHGFWAAAWLRPRGRETHRFL